MTDNYDRTKEIISLGLSQGDSAEVIASNLYQDDLIHPDLPDPDCSNLSGKYWYIGELCIEPGEGPTVTVEWDDADDGYGGIGRRSRRTRNRAAITHRRCSRSPLPALAGVRPSPRSWTG